MTKAVKQWTPKQRQFIGWLAVPEDLRVPQTQRDFAKELKVNEVTLSRWKREPGLTEEAAAIAREMVTEELASIYGALVKQAKRGSFQHIKLALEVAGEHTDEVNVNVGDYKQRLAGRLGVADEVAARREARRAS